MAACGDDAKPVVAPSPNPQPAQPVVVSVEISGPSTVAPGQSAQFTAITRLSDGTSQPAATVQWRSTNTSVLCVSGSGLATAEPRTGEAVLSADVTITTGVTRRSTKEVVVLPDGTYRMVGMVTDAEFQATPVVGARVEVTTGTPVVATTDWDGRYRLYGVPGEADVRVSRDGYQPRVQSLRLTAHVTQNFQLVAHVKMLTMESTA